MPWKRYFKIYEPISQLNLINYITKLNHVDICCTRAVCVYARNGIQIHQFKLENNMRVIFDFIYWICHDYISGIQCG